MIAVIIVGAGCDDFAATVAGAFLEVFVLLSLLSLLLSSLSIVIYIYIYTHTYTCSYYTILWYSKV